MVKRDATDAVSMVTIWTRPAAESGLWGWLVNACYAREARPFETAVGVCKTNNKTIIIKLFNSISQPHGTL